MATSINELDLEEAAHKAAGNWQDFDSFVWWRARELDDAENHAVIYTHHRDSGILDQSNAAVIAKALEPYTDGDDPDVTPETHNHWAVGWISGFAIRVFQQDGEITDAFRCYHELSERMENYPILDESDYSDRECEATIANIGQAAWRLRKEYKLPDDWQSEVFSWFSDHNQSAVENVDDQGGWPEEDDLKAAFSALGYARAK
jgi:hypothetical protein